MDLKKTSHIRPIEKVNETDFNKFSYLLGLPKQDGYFLHPKAKTGLKIFKENEREYIELNKSSKFRFPIGRNNGDWNNNALIMNDDGVSKKHCSIGYNPELGVRLPHYFIIDIGSTNGTKINGIYYDDNWQKQEGELILSKDAQVVLPLYPGESTTIIIGKLGLDLEFRVK